MNLSLRTKTILAAFLFFPLIALSAPISKGKATRIAREFISNRQGGGSKEMKCTYAKKRQSPKSDADASDAAYYVFDGNDAKGFVIVAGDDRLPSIIGYSDNENFDTANMPEACKAWLDAVAYSVENLSTTEDAAVYAQSKAITYPTKVVEPLLKSQWGQDAPYNTLTPEVNGEPTVTGCVATATAQIMYYYKYPARPTGTVSYTYNGVERTLDFNSQPAFDWDNMLPTYDSGSSETSCTAVAQLMKCVGYGAKMRYGNDESSADPYISADALIKYFGYDPNIHHYERELLPDDEWVDIITSELYAARPVLYGGNRFYGGGHSFICDGYDGEGMFHFNWGWKGVCDGYYNLSALGPRTQGVGGPANTYSFVQNVECHIQPLGWGESVPQTNQLLWNNELNVCVASDKKTCSANPEITVPTTEDSGFNFYCMARSHIVFDGDVCAAVITDSGIEPIESSITKMKLQPSTYTEFNVDMPHCGLAEGTYRIGFFYRTKTEGKWRQLIANIYGPSECYVTIAADKITYRGVSPDVNVVEDHVIGIKSTMNTGSEYIITVLGRNEGSMMFSGLMGITVAKKDATGDDEVLTRPVLIASGETGVIGVTLNTTGMEPGQYVITPVYIIAITLQDDRKIIPMGRSRIVEVVEDQDLSIGNAAEVQQKPIISVSDGMLNVSSGESIKAVRITDIQGRVPVSIAAGSNSVSVPVGHLQHGIYIISVTTEHGKSNVALRI